MTTTTTTTAATNLTPEETATLVEYAARHGRTWKADLREAWMTASEPGLLQQLRNSHRFGPSGLIRFRLPVVSRVTQVSPEAFDAAVAAAEAACGYTGHTFTLRSGDVVTAKSPAWPTQYTNRTQAQRAAARIPGADVIQRTRPFYVRVGVAAKASR